MQEPEIERLRRREATVIQDAGAEGLPVVGTEQVKEFVGDSYVDSTLQMLTYCGGCNTALHDAPEIGGVCCVCRCVLCKATCAAVRCQDCALAVCTADSKKVGDAVVCDVDLARQARGAATFVALVAVVVLIVVLLQRAM